MAEEQPINEEQTPETVDPLHAESPEIVEDPKVFQIDAEAIDPVYAERDDLQEQLMRSRADYQNLARRSELNIKAARDESISSFAKNLVTVLDHFDRALQLDPEQTDSATLLAGVQSIKDELIKTMGSAGVERIEAQPGEEFDPNQHEALMRQPSEEFESGTVVVQFQPGYAINGKLIRPVQVTIAE